VGKLPTFLLTWDIFPHTVQLSPALLVTPNEQETRLSVGTVSFWPVSILTP
jgi:hypothetical protein